MAAKSTLYDLIHKYNYLYEISSVGWLICIFTLQIPRTPVIIEKNI